VPWRTFGHSLAIEAKAWAWQPCSGVLAFFSAACAGERKAAAVAVANKNFLTFDFSWANGVCLLALAANAQRPWLGVWITAVPARKGSLIPKPNLGSEVSVNEQCDAQGGRFLDFLDVPSPKPLSATSVAGVHRRAMR